MSDTSGQIGPLVDNKVFDLAEHFLQGESNITEDDKWDLAEQIQTAVENWFFMREHAVTVAAEGDEPVRYSRTENKHGL